MFEVGEHYDKLCFAKPWCVNHKDSLVFGYCRRLFEELIQYVLTIIFSPRSWFWLSHSFIQSMPARGADLVMAKGLLYTYNFYHSNEIIVDILIFV